MDIVYVGEKVQKTVTFTPSYLTICRLESCGEVVRGSEQKEKEKRT